MNYKSESLYAKKADLRTTDLHMLTLLRNISQTNIPDPFVCIAYNVTFLYRISFPVTTIAYHFDPVAAWSFDPPLTHIVCCKKTHLG